MGNLRGPGPGRPKGMPNKITTQVKDMVVAALDKAFAKDPFNVRAFNTLNLYEKTIPVEYETVDGPTFRIRYAKNERAILERYVPQFLDEAWGSMVKRYKQRTAGRQEAS